MKSTVVKRSVAIHGYKTSVSLENEFWDGIKDIAKARRTTISDLISAIDAGRQEGNNLSSAIRRYVLQYCSDPPR